MHDGRGGHGECLRRSRGDAVGVELGGSLVDRFSRRPFRRGHPVTGTKLRMTTAVGAGGVTVTPAVSLPRVQVSRPHPW
jgi:hypothetical protein